MVEIEFSVISMQTALADLQQALKDFERQTHIHVNIKMLAWKDAWSELVRVAIYKHGPDVSEIGNTWASDLAGMSVLHPFSKAEIDGLGGPEIFLKSAWEGGMLVGSPQVWSIPWLVDSRLLFYRRDILAKAGIDETTAFTTHQSLIATLQRLKDSGVAHPLVIPTHKTRMNIHNAAAWVWGAGGQFVSPDGKHATFHEPKACAGLRQYFELGQFLTGEARDLDDVPSDAFYATGKAAVTISGPWLLREWISLPDVRAVSGVTFPPGVPFIGGSNLVVWQHTTHLRESLALVNFLSSCDFQKNNLRNISLLPARQDVLASPPYTTDPITQHLHRELQIGRTFRLIPLWGLVEERLSDSLCQIWTEVLRRPQANLVDMVDSNLGQLARRLDLVLSGR